MDGVQGKADLVKGKVKESVGKMNDTRLRNEGQAQRDAGEVEEAIARAVARSAGAIKDIGDKNHGEPRVHRAWLLPSSRVTKVELTRRMSSRLQHSV
jgi:uncharacterized protein YjbJ (UPF0337 family)